MISNIKPQEAKMLLRVYQQKRSDLWRFMPNNLIEASERYNLKEAVPILREFVVEKDFNISDRWNALKVVEFLKQDSNFLKKIFNKYKNN